MATKAKPADALPRLTIANVDRYLEVRNRRLELQRMAGALQTEESQLAKDMLAHCRAAGGSTTKGKHTLTIKMLPGTVAWKTEFIRQLGADLANRLTADAPPRESLVVT